MEMSVQQLVTAWVAGAFAAAFPGRDEAVAACGASPTSNAEFGDFQSNDCMRLAKLLHRPPRAVAEAFLAAAGNPPFAGRIEVAGPGFINITLDDAWLAETLGRFGADTRLAVPESGTGRTVVMDYGSPNITKPLHIGHLRSHNIGSALDRLYRRLGYRVVADNHLGDWGTQFGITIMGFRLFGDEARMRDSPLEELERVYVKSYEKGKQDEAWLARCREELVKLQSGDPESLALWEMFTKFSLDELDRVYRRLGVRYDIVRGESYYRDKLLPMLNLLAERGLTRVSEGATVVDLDAEGLPLCIVRKSDGGFNYATSDLATAASRQEEFHPERIVYVTDERQQLHFKQVFAICRRLGLDVRMDHVWFGLMRLPDATFSTREGNVIKLDALLDKAEELALGLVRTSSPGMDEAQQRAVARAVGIGAVKYVDLSQNPQSLVTFTWEKALSMEGNSGPYLQYAYARIASVRDKYAERFPGADPDAAPIRLTDPIERALAVRLVRFPEVVVAAAESYKPSMVADYLVGLAQLYSNFYQNLPFLKAEEGVRESRVRLCGVVARVLREGLELLGIEPLERI